MTQPASIGSHEAIALFDRPDAGQAKQKTPELPGSSGPWIGPQPSAAFMLDVIEASLDSGPGPEGNNRPESRSLPICSEGKRIKTTLFETLKPLKARFKSLLGHIQVREDDLIGGMHECHQATVLMEIGAVQDEMLEQAEVLWFRRGLFKPVVFDALEFGSAVTRETGQLTDRIAAQDPEPEPLPLPEPLAVRFLPDKGLPAGLASVSLLVIGALTEFLNIRVSTITARRRAFFCPLFTSLH